MGYWLSADNQSGVRFVFPLILRRAPARLEGWAANSGASGPSFETDLKVLLRMRRSVIEDFVSGCFESPDITTSLPPSPHPEQ
jgi:hypothetical protein